MTGSADRPRTGFALLSVLVVMTAASTICLAIALDGSVTADAARNRINAERAHWAARSCLAALLAETDLLLARERDAQGRTESWRSLPSRLRRDATAETSGCVVGLEASGTRIAINEATEERLLRFFHAAGLGGARGDLTDALLDWIDEDDDPRPLGAEHSAYVALNRIPPRNGELQDPRELAHVRGFETVAERLLPMVTTSSAPISLGHASAAVLSSLPAFTPEVVARVLDRRAAGTPVEDLRELLDIVSVDASEGLVERYPEIVQLATTTAGSWIATITATAGTPGVEATIIAELAPRGDGAAVVRWTVQ